MAMFRLSETNELLGKVLINEQENYGNENSRTCKGYLIALVKHQHFTLHLSEICRCEAAYTKGRNADKLGLKRVLVFRLFHMSVNQSLGPIACVTKLMMTLDFDSAKYE